MFVDSDDDGRKNKFSLKRIHSLRKKPGKIFNIIEKFENYLDKISLTN